MEQTTPQTPPAQDKTTTIIINQSAIKGNTMGTAGFVLALVGLIFCWVPVLGWIMWLLGATLSIVGLFKTPRGLAIAGTIISFIVLIVLIVFLAAIGAAVAIM